MRLDEYIERTGIPIARLADRCGLTFSQIYHILYGKMPKLPTAIKIYKYTKTHPCGENYVEPWEVMPLEIANQIMQDEETSNKK